MIAFLITLLTACASSQETEKTLTLEKPKVVNGAIVQKDQAKQIEKSKLEAAAVKIPGASTSNLASPAKMPVAEVLSMTANKDLPPDSTKIIDLPKLSMIEINEIAEQLIMQLGTNPGYSVSSTALSESLPALPAGIVGDRLITRQGEGGTHILRFGYRRFISQPPKLWVLGIIVDKTGKFTANPDIAIVEPEITKMLTSLTAMRSGLTVRDLEAKLIQLSYVDADIALNMLASLGMTVVADATKMPPKVEFAKLPYVVKVTDPKKEYTGLIGAKTSTSGSKLSLTPGVASEMTDNAIASPMTQFMVMFHPAHPEQFSEVRKALDDFIDRPARQIFIECMVLEISEQGLKDLGIEWELSDPLMTLSGGALNAGTENADTLNFNAPNTSLLHNVLQGDFQWDWDLTIRALVRTGKAEILSRPSVLTLNNRQSTIRVGRDIPIASSLQGMSNNSSNVSFNFVYLPTGILLNIRPRINEDGTEVSMLIDTIVSAIVPDEDLEMLSPDKTVLASAPTVSTRRVQTYGRINNNTPLIIGGLVANQQTITTDKVPLLGDIPLLGILFRGEKKENTKREVIIVLTPHVLPEKRNVRRSIPKDEDSFDNFGNNLFRDSYRIRGEDVFDLSFLLDNHRVVDYRNMARQVVAKNFRLGETEPFRSFVRDSIPGESILVSRMIYEVIKRLDVAEKIDRNRIIYFEGQQVGGYDVKFLNEIVDDEDEDGLLDLDNKALAIIYHMDRESLEEGRLGSEPIPEIKLVECADRDAWGKKLWELNQPTADGKDRYTILIKDESDVMRLRRAMVLKKICTLNGGLDQLRMKNFSVGKVLLMPELKKDQIHVIDANTARFFFHTEHYYAAALNVIEEQLEQLDKELRRPEINMLLDSAMPDGDTTGLNK